MQIVLNIESDSCVIKGCQIGALIPVRFPANLCLMGIRRTRVARAFE